MPPLRTQPFGASMAPANWARVTEFVKFALCMLCGIHLRVRYRGIKLTEDVRLIGGSDDCFTFDPRETVGSSFEMS